MKDKRSKQRPKIGMRFFITCAMIVIASGAIVAIAMTRPAPDVPDPVTASPLATTSTPGFGSTDPLGATALAGNPTPYQYDAVNDRYWDPSPGHNHWHTGRPPSTPPTAPTPVTTTTGTVPAPWSYDAANNQHWHPGHGHYHPGPPPPQEQRQ